MKPIFRLTINRQELTQAMKDRVLKITVEDSAGYENDNCVVEIDGREPYPKFPKSGAILEVEFGYDRMKDVTTELDLQKLGIYELSDLDWDGSPWQLTLNFNAMSMMNMPKTARNELHEDTDLKKLVEKLAQRMGYQPKVANKFAEIKIHAEMQKNMTDMEFINWLAQRHGAFPKVYHQRLHFAAKDGSNFVDQLLRLEQCIPGSVKYHSAVRGVYGNIEAATFSYDTGKLQRLDVNPDVKEMEDAPATMELTRLYDTADKARSAVESKKQFLESAKDTLSFKCGGNPLMYSHRKLRLSGGKWHPDMPTDWIIVGSTHTWTKGDGEEDGYVTEVKCEVLTEGQEDSDNGQSDGLDSSNVGES